MSQLPIRTERLLLRPARAEDLAALLVLWREPALGRYLFDGDSPTPEQAALRLFEHLSLAHEGLGLWLLQGHVGSAVLGCATLRPAPRGALEPSIALHPQHQGRGLAQEALGALLAHAADALGGAPLVASCCVPDHAGDRMLRRLGFVPRYECDGGRYRVRQYRPGVRRGDMGVVARWLARERRAA